uniref:B box-type domain-containing protein n=1 Tax=Eutreptiella gymnastica TaxID=73025 RepID=A0A7S1IHW6_9EUGL|mmetsp:Transcript_17896/g.31750  ORF Transcript_17896/g.31750 Transcript_17896/m.31750 type:complete len:532 (+) Transcript_17896:25-1620(+)
MDEEKDLYSHTQISQKIQKRRNQPCHNISTTTGNLEDETNSDISDVIAGWCCEHEGERQDFFCLVDLQLVCAYCLLVGSHTNHSHVPIKDAGRAARSTLVQQLAGIDEASSQLRRRLGDCERKLQTIDTEFECRTREVNGQITRLQVVLKDLEAKRKCQHHQVLAQFREAQEATEQLYDMCEHRLCSSDAILAADPMTLRAISPELVMVVPLMCRELEERHQAVRRLMNQATTNHAKLQRVIQEENSRAPSPNKHATHSRRQSSQKHKSHLNVVESNGGTVTFDADSHPSHYPAGYGKAGQANSKSSTADTHDTAPDGTMAFTGLALRDAQCGTSPGVGPGKNQMFGSAQDQSMFGPIVMTNRTCEFENDSFQMQMQRLEGQLGHLTAAIGEPPSHLSADSPAESYEYHKQQESPQLSDLPDHSAGSKQDVWKSATAVNEQLLMRYCDQEKDKLHHRIQRVLSTLNSGCCNLASALQLFTQLRNGLREALVLQDVQLVRAIGQGMRHLRDQYNEVAGLFEPEETDVVNSFG